MTRPLRIQFPGATYHVMSRGNEKQSIFRNPVDRRVFLRFLDSAVFKCGWECFAYCLMENHFHLLVRTPAANLSEGMRRLNGVYSQWFNKRYDRVGHLMQGRYMSRSVEKDSHFIELTRYVVLNPVRAGLCGNADDWEWSSFRATAGLCPAPRFLARDLVLQHFSGDSAVAEKAYVQYVLGEDLRTESNTRTESHREECGQDPFTEERVPLNVLLDSGGDLAARNDMILTAHLDSGYTVKEIADFLGLHISTVSKIINAEFNSRV